MSHTPGPWFNTYEGGVIDKDGAVIFRAAARDAKHAPRNHDNALLASCAPDLLAACEAIRDWLNIDDSAEEGTIFAQLVAAIAKAKGDA
jgi:hypothetical protein